MLAQPARSLTSGGGDVGIWCPRLRLRDLPLQERGEAVSDEVMARLAQTRHHLCPQGNYTLAPRPDPQEMVN